MNDKVPDNELARKQRTEGLTEEEIKEQVQLRAQYVAAIRRASAAVAESGQAGPEAIISSGSPSTSERTTVCTCAGAQASAKRPPLTAERRLRIVLISTISAPQARS